MTINNITELGNLVRMHGLSALANGLTKCLNEYSALCHCRPSEKSDKLIECSKHYIETINNFTNNKYLVFNKINEPKIEFYENGRLISVLTR